MRSGEALPSSSASTSSRDRLRGVMAVGMLLDRKASGMERVFLQCGNFRDAPGKLFSAIYSSAKSNRHSLFMRSTWRSSVLRRGRRVRCSIIHISHPTIATLGTGQVPNRAIEEVEYR